MRIVLDTNVLVSSILKPSSKPAEILNLVMSGKLLLHLDSRIFLEYSSVLKRKKFDFAPKKIEHLLQYFHRISFLTTPKPLMIHIPDLSDLPFIEVAYKTDSSLITGNKKHFPLDLIKVYDCKEFLDFYFGEDV